MTREVRLRLGLLASWPLAGMFNAGEWVYGRAPSTIGSVASVVVVLSWFGYGYWRAHQPHGGWIFPTVMWVVVVSAGMLGYWLYALGSGSATASQGLGSVLLLFVGTAPLHGLTALLGPAGDLLASVRNDALVYVAATVLFFAVRKTAKSNPTTARP